MAPVAIIRGEWDSMCRDDDAQWLFAAFARAPIRRDVKIGRATHLMHLEFEPLWAVSRDAGLSCRRRSANRCHLRKPRKSVMFAVIFEVQP